MGKRFLLAVIAFSACFPSIASAANDDEITLFDGAGNAQAYISLGENLTIYLWGGTPVAYLSDAGQGKYDVFGFNGKHLGWFERGVVWDPDGNGACAVKEALGSTNLEPLKLLKELKPLKSLRELTPLHPLLSGRFGRIPCGLLLGSGSE